MQVEIFTGPSCKYCLAAKNLLDDNKIAYKERDVSNPETLAEFQERLPRIKSIPQIFVDDKHIGGYEDLQLLLDALIK